MDNYTVTVNIAEAHLLKALWLMVIFFCYRLTTMDPGNRFHAIETQLVSIETQLGSVKNLESKVDTLISFLKDDPQESMNDYDNATEIDDLRDNDISSISSVNNSVVTNNSLQLGASASPSINITPNIIQPPISGASESITSDCPNLGTQYSERLSKYIHKDNTSEAVNDDLTTFINTAITSRLSQE